MFTIQCVKYYKKGKPKMRFCKRLLSFIFGGRPSDISCTGKPIGEDGREVVGTIVSHNVDRLSEYERAEFVKAASEFSEVPLFDGHVEYGYSLEGVADETRCPRCGGAAALRYANFIYMSQKAMRVMYAPAGFFCTQCPTVSVNEDLIRVGITDKRHQYKRVVGIDYGNKKDADYFRKWNGKDLVYVFDEDQTLLDITTTPEHGDVSMSMAAGRHKSTRNRRKRQEKKARKRNRGKQ